MADVSWCRCEGDIMVTRCGYYVENGKVKSEIVEIEWNLGFDKVAKQEYVKSLHEELHKLLPDKRIIEVTTAAEPPGKWLSPIYIKFLGGESLEDVWQKLNKAHTDYLVYDNYVWKKPFNWKAFVHYYSLYGDVKLSTIRRYDVFTDVFHNPTKQQSTQALGCAVMRLMYELGHLDVRNSLKEFCEWCDNFVDI